MSLDFSEAGKTFGSQTEITDCFSNILDLHIYYIYKYHSWVGPDNSLQNMIGVVVSRQEFENNLLGAADSQAYSSLSEEEASEIIQTREYFRIRIANTINSGADFPVLRLASAFEFDDFRFFTVLMLLCCELNKKYEKLFAYIQDDITKKLPEAETAIRLFAEPKTPVSRYYRYFSDNDVLMKYLCEKTQGSIGTGLLKLRKHILEYVIGEPAKKIVSPDKYIHEPYVNADILDCICAAAKSAFDKTAIICLSGAKGSGRRFLARHCAKRLNENILFADSAEICRSDSICEAVYAAVCERTLYGGAICFTGFECFLQDEDSGKLSEFAAALESCREFLGSHVFVTCTEKWQDAQPCESMVKIDFVLPEADEATRLVLWDSFMNGQERSFAADPKEMAAKFRFTPGQIAAAVRRSTDLAKFSGEKLISEETLHKCCYDQVVAGLNTLATPIKPAYSWDDLVLPESEVRQLKEACTHVKYRHTVYNEWGLGKRAAYGRGLSVLFSGPPGTGKTMAAQVVTNQLHMQMYKIQLSQIVSKYIGETEKNLRQVFTEAKNANCILFFDEMDALFGKRSEVKDSHDRHANIETAYLLQQMEDYDGVVLMATNLLQNIDEAFMRRINFVISFPFPDASTRKLLWQKMLDTGAPISDDIDFDFLAKSFKLAGGNIKNCAVHAAFLAAAESSPVSMKHLISSVVSEQRKNNVVVLREDLKEYADMVFGEK